MIAAKKTFPFIATLVAFLAVVTMLKLGFWQLERMTQKQQRLENLKERQMLQPLTLVEALAEHDEISDLPVRFVATPDTERLLFLDNRIVNGTVGYEVLAFSQTNVGYVLLNYGWVAAPSLRSELPNVNLLAGQQAFSGNIVVPTLNPVVRETAQASDGYPIVIQQLDLTLVATLTGVDIEPFVVALAEQGPEFTSNWQPVVMSPEKHLGYAIQWFGLAFAAIIIFIIALRKRKKKSD